MNLSDLSTKGYLVIKNFFAEEFINSLIADFKSVQLTDNKNYAISNVSDQASLSIHKTLAPILENLKNNTPYGECLLTWEAAYLDNTKIKFGFHQEHEPHFVFQDLSKYLIFYIPLIKQYEDQSGVYVVPNDVVRQQLPEYADFMLGSGAKTYGFKNSKTIVLNDSTDQYTEIPADIRRLAVVPKILPGDLLIMSGLTIHSTQDQKTERLALSIRYVNADTVIRKDTLFNSGGDRKKMFLNNNKKMYDGLETFFNQNNIQETTAKDLLKIYNKRIGNEKDYPN